MSVKNTGQIWSTTISGIVAVALAALAAPANAELASPGSSDTYGGYYEIDSSEFEQARGHARMLRGFGLSEQQRSEVNKFLKDTERRGGAGHDPSEIDVVRVNKDITLTLSRSVRVKKIAVKRTVMDREVAANGDEGELRGIAVSVEADSPEQNGPTNDLKADDYPGFTIDHNENLRVTISGAGEMLAIANGGKLNNDGGSSRNYWAYEHKAVGQPFDISGLDWSVTGMILENYLGGTPTLEMVKNHRWVAFSPGAEIESNCGQQWNLGIDVLGATFGGVFTMCDTYKPNVATAWPGTMRLTHTQGAVFNPGNRELGYTTAHSVPKNESQIRPTMGKATLQMARWTYPASECTAGSIYGDTVTCNS